MMAWPKGRPRTTEQKQAISRGLLGHVPTPEARINASRTLKGRVHSEESRAKNAASHKGTRASSATRLLQSVAHLGKPGPNLGKTFGEETRAKVARTASKNFRGGNVADSFASFLCPAGFTRERVVQWGSKKNERYQLDFAHLRLKVCIELDGPNHKNTKEYDGIRDARLKSLGWITIRVPHA